MFSRFTLVLAMISALLSGCYSVDTRLDEPIDAGPDSGAAPDADPASVNISLSAPISWVFDAGTLDYSLETSLLTQETIVVVLAPAATEISLNDSITLESGVPSAPIFLTPGANTLEITIEMEAGPLTYTLEIDRGGRNVEQLAYVKASNTNASDQFGISIDIDGDTMVVGATGEDGGSSGVDGDEGSNSRSGSGAAYVFRREGALWIREAYLKASNTQADDNFGMDVAIAGDTIAVGADREDSNATGVNGDQTNDGADSSGAVYVFRREGATWSQEAYLKASNTGAGDRFGFQVSLSGDTLAVGAWGEDSSATGINGNQADNSASSAGAAYVFRRDGSGWAQEAYVKASNTDASDFFGWSLAVDGDDLVIGAYGEDSGGGEADDSLSAAGAVYAYRRTGTTWTQVGYLKPATRGAGDQFGFSVDVSRGRLAVGAFEEDSSATGIGGDANNDAAMSSGAAYVYTWSGSFWGQQTYVKASNTGGGDAFGVSVGIHESTLVVGAMLEESNAVGVNGNQDNDSVNASGAAYVFRFNGSTWSQIAYAKASNTGENDLFGYSVAASADGVVVGARDEASAATGVDGDGANDDASMAGAIYVFR